jgi:hypothetical protein
LADETKAARKRNRVAARKRHPKSVIEISDELKREEQIQESKQEYRRARVVS